MNDRKMIFEEAALNIPTELLIKIVSYLSPEEKRIGLFICKDWYEVFRHGLYNTVYLKTMPQLQMMLGSLIISSSSVQNVTGKLSNGQLVKKLFIQNNKFSLQKQQEDIMTEALFECLPDLCPNLELLDFDSDIWRNVVYNDNIEKWKNRIQQLPTLTNMGTSFPYLEKLGHSLSTLSLQSDMLVSISTQSALTSILCMVPCIQKLIISSCERSPTLQLTVQDIELIHKLLPHLDSLQITGNNVHLILGDLDQINKIPTAVANLTALHLNTRLATPDWVYYIAHKYPQLRNLTLNIQFDDENHWWDAESIQAERSLLLYLIRKCHHLEVISLSCPTVDHWLNRSFLETLLLESRIRQITPIVKRNNQIKFDSDFTVALEYGKDLITALEIEQWRFNTKLHSTVNFLSSFSQLSYLNIICDSYNGEHDLEKLLDNCPLLETLVLEWGTLHAPSALTTTRYHPLNTLDITFIAFTPCVFKYLSQRCPSLTNLYIYKCKQLSALNDPVSQTQLLIDMPHNRFHTILIHGVRLDCSSAYMMFAHGISSYIRLASIKEATGIDHWYQHIGYKNKNDRSHPMLEELESYDVNQVRSYFAQRQACPMPNNQRAFLKTLSTQRINDTMKLSLTLGYVKVNCRAIDNFSLDSYIVISPQ